MGRIIFHTLSIAIHELPFSSRKAPPIGQELPLFDARFDSTEKGSSPPEERGSGSITLTLPKENRRQNRGHPNGDLAVALLCRSSGGLPAYWTKVQYTDFQIFARVRACKCKTTTTARNKTFRLAKHEHMWNHDGSESTTRWHGRLFSAALAPMQADSGRPRRSSTGNNGLMR
jgi:hypothetical protein